MRLSPVRDPHSHHNVYAFNFHPVRYIGQTGNQKLPLINIAQFTGPFIKQMMVMTDVRVKEPLFRVYCYFAQEACTGKTMQTIVHGRKGYCDTSATRLPV